MAERKRPLTTDSTSTDTSKKIKLIQTTLTTRPLCKYGAQCYRKHPDHVRAYRHPSEATGEEEEVALSVLPKSTASESPSAKMPSSNVESCNSTVSLMELSELNGEERLSRLYQMEFPSDLHAFWSFCSSINANNPRRKRHRLHQFTLLCFPFRRTENHPQLGTSGSIRDSR